jgi:hypothetical protein
VKDWYGLVFICYIVGLNVCFESCCWHGLLLEHPVMAHLGMLSSILAHWQNLSILFIYGCMCFMLLVIMAKSSAYATELSVYCDVLSL